MVEVPANHRGACFRAEHGRIHFQVVDARNVDLPLPQTHRCANRSGGLPAVVRRRSMMVSIGQRTPTNKTGKPLSRRAQSGRILCGTAYQGANHSYGKSDEDRLETHKKWAGKTL
jgi:hypothetical protein